jgi:hypothetical protein
MNPEEIYKNKMKTKEIYNKTDSFIIFSYEYFTHLQGRNIKKDYLCFDKNQLINFFNRARVRIDDDKSNLNIPDILDCYRNLTEKQITYLFERIKYILKNDNFFNFPFSYKDIKFYQLIDCIPEERFYTNR